VALSALVALLAIVDVYFGYAGPGFGSVVGQWGNTVGAAAEPYHLKVLSIDPGHASDLAGLRTGDLIDLRANTALERFWLAGQPPPDRHVTVRFTRNGVDGRATIVPQRIVTGRELLLAPIWLGFLWIALFSGVIAWRRAGDAQMRRLCFVLIAYGLWETTNAHYLTSDSLWLIASAATINALGVSAVAFWAACAASFGTPAPARRIVLALCYAFAGIAVAVGMLRVAGLLTLAFDPIPFASSPAGLPFVIAFAAGTFCTVFAIRATGGPVRQRAIWSLAPSGFLILVGFGAEAVQGVITSYNLAWGMYYGAAAINVLTPMVLTYVALNRRLLDIGFVLNRAAVYAIVSAALIVTFIVIEFVANELLSVNHTTSVIVGIVTALAIGVSMKYVHQAADRIVDRIFFHKRHEAEAAMRHFAHEAGFITDREVLLERTLAVVRASTDAEAALVLFDEPEQPVDENDPALVAMRAWHKRVDLERYPESALSGQFAFPLVARGTLLGALVCGTKEASEVYAPDEAEALQLLADGVGHALGVLDRTQPNGEGSVLAETVAELRAAIRDLRELKAT
jgi:hypothetical protein